MSDQEAQISEQEKKKFIESDAGDGTRREDQYLTGSKLIICFSSVFLCMFLSALDQTIVVTILATVGNKFNAFNEVGWLASGFMLTSAVFIQVFGRMSIILGRKYTMIVGVILFEAGSLMCGLAPNMNVLIGGRVLAGIGAAGIQELSLVIVTEIIPIDRRPIGIAIISLTFVIASIIGPLIGGGLTTHATWRWCFYINLPIGGVAIAFFWFAFNPPLPKTNVIEELKKFDYFGAFLMISGFVVFLLALTFGGVNYAWNSAPVILCFVLGGVTVIAFAIWNIYFATNKLFPNEITRVPQIMAAAVSISAMFAYFMGVIIYGALYFQVIHGASALNSGLHVLPILITVVLTAVVSSIFAQRYRYVKPIIVSSGIVGPLGAGLLCLLKVDSPFSQQVGLFIIPGLALGLSMQLSVISAQIVAPKTPGSTILVTTLIAFSRSMGGAIGSDLSDAVYTASLQNIFSTAIKHETNPQILQDLQGINISQLVSDNSFIATLSPATQYFVKVQVMHAIRNVFYMCIGFGAIAAIANLFTTNKRLPAKAPKKKEGEEEEGEEEEGEEGEKEKEKGEEEGEGDIEGEGEGEGKDQLATQTIESLTDSK